LVRARWRGLGEGGVEVGVACLLRLLRVEEEEGEEEEGLLMMGAWGTKALALEAQRARTAAPTTMAAPARGGAAPFILLGGGAMALIVLRSGSCCVCVMWGEGRGGREISVWLKRGQVKPAPHNSTCRRPCSLRAVLLLILKVCVPVRGVGECIV